MRMPIHPVTPEPRKIARAVEVLKKGGVIAYPTEAVYGIGCLPWSWPAVERVLRLKRRPRSRGLILIASRLEQIEPLVRFDGVDRSQVLATWPGPVTWILPPSRLVPEWVRGEGGGVAIRVTAYPPAVFDLRGNAQPIPDLSWVRIKARRFVIPPHGRYLCRIALKVPTQKTFKGKSYQVMIWTRTELGGKPSPGPGLISKIQFRTPME